jgi:hypothetical protein
MTMTAVTTSKARDVRAEKATGMDEKVLPDAGDACLLISLLISCCNTAVGGVRSMLELYLMLLVKREKCRTAVGLFSTDTTRRRGTWHGIIEH